MIGSPLVRRLRQVGVDRRDQALGITLALGAEAEMTIRGTTDAVTLISVAAAGLSLWPMRRRPWPMIALFIAAFVGRSVIVGGDDSDVVAFAAVVAPFRIGLSFPPRRSLAMAAVLAAGYAADQLVLDQSVAASIIFASLLSGVTWFAGWLLYSQAAMTEELRLRNSLLERERERGAQLAAAAERSRVAAEVHTVVATAVAQIVAHADRGREDPDRAAGAFPAIEDSGRAALARMRGMLGLLRAGDEELALAPQPSLSEASALVERARREGVPVQLTVAGDARPLPAGLDVSAYRILQEALRDVTERTTDDAAFGASKLTLRIDYEPADVCLRLLARGRRRPLSRGDHWLAIRERVALHGGELRTERHDDETELIMARLPLEVQDA